jgi:large subunit ribosomal protein L25
MQAAATFNATTRETNGKGAARALRREGKIPAIIYGETESNVGIALESNLLEREYRLGGFFSKLLELKAGNDTLYVIPKDIQLHPVTDRIEHIDFMQVTEKSTIKVRVAVRFLGMDKCVGIKRGGNLNIVRHELELVCNVNNIPRSIEIDISKMNIGDSLHISSVELPEGVSSYITDRDFTIASLAGRGGKQDSEDSADDAAAEAAASAEGDAKAEEKKD